VAKFVDPLLVHSSCPTEISSAAFSGVATQNRRGNFPDNAAYNVAAGCRAARWSKNCRLFDLRLAIQMFKALGCYTRKRNESENVGSCDFLFQFPV
jgi:hypothetical protein